MQIKDENLVCAPALYATVNAQNLYVATTDSMSSISLELFFRTNERVLIRPMQTL